MTSFKDSFNNFLDRMMAATTLPAVTARDSAPMAAVIGTPVVAAPEALVACLPVSSVAIKPRMTGATIAFVNRSTVVTDAQIAALVKALQIQIDRDFSPVWMIAANLKAVPTNATPAPEDWVIAIMDTSDQAGALGYHDITATGTPLGRVFAKDDLKYGLSWTVTVSHETLEMLVDPWIDNTVFNQLTNTTGMLYALEVADACLTGDTMIPLLDGTSSRIDQLVGKDEFFVYSTTPSGDIRPGRGHAARCTRTDAELVEVILDNDQAFKCTPDHRIMLRDGTFRLAGELNSGDSLMPLYRRKHAISETNKPDYEQVFNPADNQWKRLNPIPEQQELLCAVFEPPFRKTVSANAKKLNHNQWHVKRAKPSPSCELCVAAQAPINHKVREVRSCGRADVYDITVDDYHNFAVEAGVFVHNCEDDSFGYEINGILVSDFVYPAWFEGFRAPNSTQFDHCKLIKRPFELLLGGYIGVFPVNPQTQGWNQLLASGKPGARALHKNAVSRTIRRGIATVDHFKAS